MKSYSESYKGAGVDITAGYDAVTLIKKHMKKTQTPGALSDIGGFGGLFLPDISNIKDFLTKTYWKYKSKEYKKYFEWIDHIKKVKDNNLKDQLDVEIINLIQNSSPTIWMAVPEVIEWENISGFKYKGKNFK